MSAEEGQLFRDEGPLQAHRTGNRHQGDCSIGQPASAPASPAGSRYASCSSPAHTRASRGQGGWCKPSPSCKPAVDGAAEARAQELQQSLQGKSVRHEAQAAQVAQERTLQLSRLRHRHQMIVSTKQQTFERRLAEHLHQEEQLQVKLRHEAEALQRQTERGEAERSRRASEALQRAECVRQRRLLKEEEEQRAALELARKLERKLARRQDASRRHQALEEGLQRMRLRIAHQETLLQNLKKGRSGGAQEPPEATDLIPAGYLTPPKARPCHSEEWDDECDGTMEGSLGYANILESPPAAYVQLQARLLARRQCTATD